MSSAPVTPRSPPAATFQNVLKEALQGMDLLKISIGEMRRDLAQRLGFALDALDGRMDEIKELMREVVAVLQDGEDGAVKTPLELFLADGEVGRGAGPQWVYLITIARVLAAQLVDGRQYKDIQNIDRKSIGLAVLDAFDNTNRPPPTASHHSFRDGTAGPLAGNSDCNSNADHVATPSHDSEGTGTSMEFHWLCSPNNLPARLPTSTVHSSSVLLKACALRIGRTACNAPLLP